MISLKQLVAGTPYVGYSYSYPHKTAYRRLDPPVPLRDAWADEGRDALFLYLHVPFCEMRCGFCNLFTTANPNRELVSAYLASLKRQAARVRDALGDCEFARMAIGGGTPTFLSASEIESLLDIARDSFDVDLSRVPCSVETSPRTADIDKLRVLRDRGVSRISIGVQSFIEDEVSHVGRAQKNEWVDRAIDCIRDAGFPTLNVDLIYGLEGQTPRSTIVSVESALRHRPQEIYLYPLYVRPLTGLQRWGGHWDDVRLDCYRAARDLLLSRGYRQLSMRMFRATDAPDADGPVYCCQDDGMVGIGCGARSYTRKLHYSTEYAVGATGVREIIADYIATRDDDFDLAHYGAMLDEEDQRRRWVIKSLLRTDGLSRAAYRDRFEADIDEDLPALGELEEVSLAERDNDTLRLTAAGLERSDAIGPWLYSNAARARMAAFELH